MILKGTAIASEPLPYLYYCNYYFGKFLSSLYVTFPDIAWYYYWLTALHFCSDLVLGYFLFRPKKILPVLGYIIYLTTISLNVYLTISYTAVIGISSAAIAVAYFNFVHVKSSWRVGGVLFALLFAASFTRFEPAFIGMAIFALPSLYLRRGDFTDLQKGNFSCLKLWLPITLIVVVIPLSTTLASSEKFKESGWTEFREVNKLKQQINEKKINLCTTPSANTHSLVVTLEKTSGFKYSTIIFFYGQPMALPLAARIQTKERTAVMVSKGQNRTARGKRQRERHPRGSSTSSSASSAWRARARRGSPRQRRS